MEAVVTSSRIGSGSVWTGRVLSGLAVAFLTFDAVMHLVQPPFVVAANDKLGFSPTVVLTLGIIQLLSLAAYLVPRTAVLGAVVWTGYLGGAVATHVRIGSPLFSHVLFGAYIGVLAWGGLWLRNPRLRALFPIVRG